MPVYTVYMTRTVTSTGSVEIDAANEDVAQDMVEKLIEDESYADSVDWEPDDDSIDIDDVALMEDDD